MILLIVAILVALILFWFLRVMAIPVILVLGAGYIYQRVSGVSSPSSGESRVEPIVARTNPLPRVTATAEIAVCQALDTASNAFVPLKAEFKAAEVSKEPNAIRRDHRLSAARLPIDQQYAARNRAVLTAMGWANPVASKWLIQVTGISSQTKDFGRGPAQYATLEGTAPCRTPTTVTSTDILVTSSLGAKLGSLNVRDFILLDGEFVKHDAASNPPEVAIEWGGPLYGPFGGLWSDAIEAPAFRIKVTNIEPL